MTKKMLEEEIQKKYIQMQMMKQQANAMMEEKGAIDQRISELAMTIDAVEKLAGVRKDSSIWAPIGNGSFVLADVKETENVFVSIGAGVVVKQTRERSLEILSQRRSELVNLNNEMVKELNTLAKELNDIETDLQELVQKQE